MRPCNAHDGERCHLLVSSMCRQLLQPFDQVQKTTACRYIFQRMHTPLTVPPLRKVRCRKQPYVVIYSSAYTPNGCPSASRRGGEGQRGLEAELHALQTASAQQHYIYIPAVLHACLRASLWLQ
jgi:hypothetical protein